MKSEPPRRLAILFVVSEAGLEPARPFSQSLAPQASASANSATPTFIWCRKNDNTALDSWQWKKMDPATHATSRSRSRKQADSLQPDRGPLDGMGLRKVACAEVSLPDLAQGRDLLGATLPCDGTARMKRTA